MTFPNEEYFYGECHRPPLAQATYRRAANGSRDTDLIFDPSAVAEIDLRDWLEERLGPLAHLDIKAAAPPEPPAPSPPAPPRPDPDKASQPQGENVPVRPEEAIVLTAATRLAALSRRLDFVRPPSITADGLAAVQETPWRDRQALARAARAAEAGGRHRPSLQQAEGAR